ncbi:MAG: LptF/LptG family permease [Candidatus Marinimicrobia bacterium]|nr:LptF/LptG family permease [Candidatus Neomarinimicrobiota bacterium]
MKKLKQVIQKIYYYSGGWIGARYIFRELISPFFFSISVVTFVLLMNFLLKEIDRLLGKELPVWVILEWIYLNMAWIIALAVPMAVLVASIMAYGRLAEDNEIVAMRSSGISFIGILTPAIFFGIIVTVLMVLFQNNVLPDYNHRARLLTGDIYHKKPGLTIEPGYFIDDMEGYSIYIKEKKDELLLNMIIYKDDPDKVQTTIYADSGRIEVQGTNVVISLFDGEIHELDLIKPDKYRRMYFTKHKIGIPVDDMILERREQGRRGDREMNISMMKKQVETFLESKEKIAMKIQEIAKEQLDIHHYKNLKEIKKTIDARIDSNNQVLSEAKAKIENRRLEGIFNRIKTETNMIQNYQKKVNKYMVEIHKKISMPFACLVFVLIGTPLGVMSRKGGIAQGAVTSILFFLIYYVFLIGGEELADMAIISPFIAMWAPNFLLLGVGIYLIYSATFEVRTFDILEAFNLTKKIKERKGKSNHAGG